MDNEITTPAAAPAPAVDPANAVDWRESVAEDIRQAPDLADVTGVSDLAAKYLAVKRAAGTDMIPMPKTDEETAAVFKKLGVPDSADGYELPAFGDVSEEDKADLSEMDGVLKRAAFGANLTKGQLTAFRDAFYRESKAQYDAEKVKTDAEHAKIEQELRAEFGASFESRIRDFKQICDSVGMTDALRALGAGFSKDIIKGVLALGGKQIEPAGAPIGTKTTTTAGIEAQIAALTADPAYMDASNPRHSHVVSQAFALRQRKNGEI